MTQPLAMLVYEGILPGSQLINGLRELGYRVSAVKPGEASALALQELPMVILVDLVSEATDTAGMIAALRAEPPTAHIPIIGFAPIGARALQLAARKAGATLIAVTDGILEQLPALLSQALELE